MYNNIEEFIDGYAFHFLEDLTEPPIQLLSVGKETRRKNTYYFDNRNRSDCYLFQYTIDGGGIVKIKGQEHAITKEEAFFLKLPGEECYYFKEDVAEAWDLYYVIFRGEAVKPYYEYVISQSGIIQAFPQQNPVIRLLQRLYIDAREGKIKDPFTAGCRAFELLCCLCSSNASSMNKYSKLTSRAKDWLEQEYADPAGISGAANALGVSQSHLSREFSKEMGIPPVDYLCKIRLEQSIHLLSTTSMHIDEIAITCGFSCGNYFSKVFKKHMQMSPVAFREYVKKEGYRYVQI